MEPASCFYSPAALLLAPLLLGVINRVKAALAGRTGRPLFQVYFDLFKLLQKGAVYSRTTSAVFRLGPPVVLASTLAALTLMPMAGTPALLSFEGDVILFVYLLGLGRMALLLAALDTGSAFEGMGASREAAFSTLAEPALLLLFLALAEPSRSLSLTGIFAADSAMFWPEAAPLLILAVISLFVLLLLENCRIPFDDPNTHLELTMIHEVMILDHSGPDLALLEYASALKLWILGTLLINVVLQGTPLTQPWAPALALGLLLLLAVVIGVVESSMARLRLTTVPRLIAMAMGCAVLSVILIWR